MQHSCGVVLNLLGPDTASSGKNILIHVDEKSADYTRIAMTVHSLDDAREFMKKNGIQIADSFSFGSMSVIELVAY